MRLIMPRMTLVALLLLAAAGCGGLIQPATEPATFGGGRSSGFQ